MKDYTSEMIDKFEKKLLEQFRNATWGELEDIANRIEEDIEKEILEDIKKYITTCIPNAQIINQRNFKINSHKYELEVQSQFQKIIPKRYDLAIGIQPIFDRAQAPLEMIDASFTFDDISFGKFSGCSLYLPKSLQNCIEPIQNITNEIIRTGYSVHKSIIIDKVEDQIHTDMATRLYNKLRQILEKENGLAYNDYIWLVLISNENGFYLGDSQKITTTIDNLVKNKQSYIPSKVITSFFTTIMPFEIMNSNNLMKVRRGETLDFELETSKYFEEYPDFEYSEEIIHLTKTIVAMMVSKEKKEKLIMSFPIEHKEKIKEIFTEKNLTALSDTFNDYINSSPTNDKLNMLARLVGNFTGSFTGSFLGAFFVK